jgi:hypothetical protein
MHHRRSPTHCPTDSIVVPSAPALALLEHVVEEASGTWMFCDTDSMAIVATPNGSDLIPCPRGQHRLSDGTPAIKALSYQQVNGIRARFNSLNPYDKTLSPIC